MQRENFIDLKIYQRNQLPADFLIDEALSPFLIEQLKVKPCDLSQDLRSQLPPKLRDIRPEHLEFVLKNPEKLDVFIQQQSCTDSCESSEPNGGVIRIEPISNIDYETAFRETFYREGKAQSTIDRQLTPRPLSNPGRRRDKIAQEIEHDRKAEMLIAPRFKQVSLRVWEKKNNQVRAFLANEYQGKCQICDYSFTQRNGEPYFEGVYIVSYTNARWIDRPGNALCLCSNCCAKFKHGTVKTEDRMYEEIKNYTPVREGGRDSLEISISLCGEDVSITFSERHIIETQQLLKHSSSSESHSTPILSSRSRNNSRTKQDSYPRTSTHQANRKNRVVSSS